MRRLNNVNIFHRGVKRLGILLLAISLFVGGVIFGSLNPAMPAYADVYMSAEDSVWQTSGNETCYINYTSKYYIEVSSQDGRLMAYVQLKQGDILTSQVLAGGFQGSAPKGKTEACHSTAGNPAYIIFLNGVALIGAGGKGGTAYISTGATAHDATYAPNPYENIAYDNARFSSGAGGWHQSTKGFSYGGAGNTIAGCTPANNTTTPVGNGTNYLDTNRATLISAPNKGTAVSVTLRPVIVPEKQSLSSIDDGISRIVQNLAAIKTSIDNLQGNKSTEAPVFTVVAGKDFRFATNKYDDMLSGSSGGVTVTNSTVGDGAILVSGKINTSGNYTIQINGKTFIFNVITEPSSSNVTVLLE